MTPVGDFFTISEEEAQAAAEELADYENRLTSIDTRLGRVEARLDAIDQRFAMVDQRINLLIWAVGINAAATIAIFGMLFALFSRVGDIAARLPAAH